jgi:hypothetical protein
MWFTRLGTLSIQATQSVLAVDTLEEHPPVPREPKRSEVVVQFEIRSPITEFELRNGIAKLTSSPEIIRERDH